MVKRVSRRVGRGLTLELALAAEGKAKVNLETWKKALQSHPQFSPHYEAGKGKFLDRATQRLAEKGDNADLKWLLERRHPDLFARPDQQASVRVENHTTIQLPDELIERARELAKEQSVAIKQIDPIKKAVGERLD